jgi:phage baseplate assembly protein W
MALGINRDTGQPLEGFSHLLQSVRDILTTRKGSRVMRRDYGSNIPNLVDRPIDDELRVDLYIETAQALYGYEPRLRVLDVDVLSRSSGRVELSMTAEYLPDGKVISLEGIVIR